MVKRTTEQWHALFEAHAKSGLSQARFCKEHGLCSKYFSLRKRQLSGAVSEASFVRVQRAKPTPVVASNIDWQLYVGEIKVRAVNASVEQMLGLIKGLV